MNVHGEYTITRKGQTLILKAYGAWNYEAALCFGKDYKNLVSQLKTKPWAFLVDLTDWELFTPDAAEHIQELGKWGNENNQKYEVVVCSLFIQQHLIEQSQQVLTNVEKKFCVDLEEAYKWLENKNVMTI